MSSTPITSMSMPQYSMQGGYAAPQPHTLPPLQPHHTQSPAPHPYMGQPYRPDLSRFPASTHDVYGNSSAPIMPHTTVGGHSPSYLAHPNHQPQGHHTQSYPPPPSGLPPASAAQSYPQPIAPAPPRDRRDFNGMPSGAFSYSDTKSWGMTPDVNGANGSPYGPPKDQTRTQVVGSQGRRGILPSVPGRATPVANGVNGTAKSTTIPAKDADGKFPCPHCNKTYLHAKHLKRHLLRHTGDRPYMCVLCKDTFSRSDILKRHFQKCSIRRGNPTGATHLSHPHAHLKRSQQQAAAAAASAAANPAKPLQDEVKPLVVPDHKYPVMSGHPAGQPGVDWSAFQHGADNGYMNPVFPHSMATGQESIHAPVDADRKFYPATTAGGPENGMNGLYMASTTMSGDGTVQAARQ